MNLPYVTDYIFVARNAIDPIICQRIINENRELDETWSKHSWTTHDPESGKLKQHSRYEGELSVKCVDPVMTDLLIDCIEKAILTYTNKTGVGDSIYNHMSQPRINRYTTGSNMAKHNDAISSLFEKGVGSPTLSIVGVLNTDYTGGDFIMFDNMHIKLQAGDILIFPSTFIYTHEVTTVTEGERWSFVTWVY